MGLLEDLKDESNFKPPRRAKCLTCELLKETDDKTRAALVSKLENTKIGHTAISDVLKKNEIFISRASIYRHRKDCMNVYQ